MHKEGYQTVVFNPGDGPEIVIWDKNQAIPATGLQVSGFQLTWGFREFRIPLESKLKIQIQLFESGFGVEG